MWFCFRGGRGSWQEKTSDGRIAARGGNNEGGMRARSLPRGEKKPVLGKLQAKKSEGRLGQTTVYNRIFVHVYTRRSLPIQMHGVSNHDGCPMVAGFCSPNSHDEFPACQDAMGKLGMHMVWACVCVVRWIWVMEYRKQATSVSQ